MDDRSEGYWPGEKSSPRGQGQVEQTKGGDTVFQTDTRIIYTELHVSGFHGFQQNIFFDLVCDYLIAS